MAERRTDSIFADEETIFSFSDRAPAPDQCDRAAARMTTYRVGTLSADGARGLCLIRNLSAGGARAHTDMALSLDQPLSLELKGSPPVPGRVCWIRDQQVGIAFDRPLDVAALLAARDDLPESGRPRMPRIEADRPGDLRYGALRQPVRTTGISQGGAALVTQHPLAVGANVRLHLDGLDPVEGVVRWSGDGEAGVAFNTPIAFHTLMHWLREGGEDD